MRRRLSARLFSAAISATCAFAVSGVQAMDTVDVLGIYSDHAASRLSDPEALFVSNIEYANRALANSGVNYRYNLVHVQQQNWSQDNGLGSSQLSSFAQNSAVQALREQYGADFVAGIVPQNNGLCGIGYLPWSSNGQTISSGSSRYAYSLSGHSCGGRTMAHEMGHNAGLGHSAAQNSSGSLGSWARGHGVNNSFVTIMAYSSAYNVRSSGGFLQMHSNPNLNSCNGQACGVNHQQNNGADARRALNIGGPTFASYVESKGGGGGPDPVNAPPEATNDSVSTDEDVPVTFNVLNNDSDPDGDAIQVVSVTDAANGGVNIVSSSGSVRYTPDDGFFGADSFNYTVQDSNGAQDTGRVSVTVNEVDDGGGTNPPAGDVVINGDVEDGSAGWAGVWGARIARTTRTAIDGYSIRAKYGYGVTVDMATPFDGGREFNFAAQAYPTRDTRMYVYLRVLQNGRWTYRYVTGAQMPRNRRADITKTFSLPAGEISDGVVLFYFPQRISGKVMLDNVQMSAQ